MNLDGVVPWPAAAAAAYSAAGLWRGVPLGALPWRWADAWGERVAVVDGNVRLSYADLAEATDRLAEGLAGIGLVRGDTVLVQLPTAWEFVVTTLACFRLGVVPVMMLPPHREYELVSIGTHVRAAAVIVPDSWRGYDHQALAHRTAAALPDPVHVVVAAENADNVRADSVAWHGLLARGGDPAARRSRLDAAAPDAGDVALFLLSGGTTGVPKLISRTHDDYYYNIRRCATVCAFGPETVYLAALPAAHNFPLANPGILGTLHSGGTAVLVSSPRPATVFAAIESERVTATAAVPAVVAKWADAAADTARDLSSLRYVHIGGSTLSPEIAARVGPALGARVQQVYGMAEGLVCFTRPGSPDPVAFGTQGSPISPHDELLVVGPDGAPVAPGCVGELLTRGPYTPRGYFGVPEQNAVSFTEDGWFRTGDLVEITTDGNVVVRGRLKDLINRGGEKISAAEIEALVQELPQVATTAAVAVPDPIVGERVCLFVRLRPGARLALAEVAAALTERGLAAFKIPERLEIVDDFPLTPVGKPDKKALAALLQERQELPNAS